MYVDELEKAVTKVGKWMQDADILTAVNSFRTSKGGNTASAALTLTRAGASLVESMANMNDHETRVVQSMSLQALATPNYWAQLTSPDSDPIAQRAEIVKLASRLVFANNHLPAIVNMLHATKDGHPASVPDYGASGPVINTAPGEAELSVRLTDAGEKASDPDRIARAIDGIDMLYSACASIIRKPTIDLRLDAIVARPSKDRDFRFVGSLDSIKAVFAVIDTIPAALAEIDPEQEIDLDSVVRSLPIFQDLRKLASLGTFSSRDLNDISETMHQGAMLTLESGVILNSQDSATQSNSRSGFFGNAEQFGDGEPPTLVTRSQASASAADYDEDYQQYLRERDALQRSKSEPVIDGVSNSAATGKGKPKDTRKAAIEQLLKSLGRSKAD